MRGRGAGASPGSDPRYSACTAFSRPATPWLLLKLRDSRSEEGLGAWGLAAGAGEAKDMRSWAVAGRSPIFLGGRAGGGCRPGGGEIRFPSGRDLGTGWQEAGVW